MRYLTLKFCYFQSREGGQLHGAGVGTHHRAAQLLCGAPYLPHQELNPSQGSTQVLGLEGVY